MEIVQFFIEGVSPLLTHNPSGMAPAGDDRVSTKTKIAPPDVEAERGVYYSPLGLISLPTAAFRGCLASAAKGRKFGKAFATSVVKGSVFPADEWTTLTLPNGAPMERWTVDARRAVLGTGKSAKGIIRGRPRFEEWAATVNFEYDADFLHPDQIGELLAIGGRTVGVGDFRPENSGPFGRFQLVDAPAPTKRARK